MMCKFEVITHQVGSGNSSYQQTWGRGSLVGIVDWSVASGG